ncbi:MAG TPA: GNAT family N-acetyltransferase [Vineibacter sp.]|nr:GNAT family N-acetyltransferase [Vineibacter sp.]
MATLARNPLRNIVLLKHLDAYPHHTRVRHVEGTAGTATLVLLDVEASAYDRRTYPAAAIAAMIASDHADLTCALLDDVPRDVGVVFKLASDVDRDVVGGRFPGLARTTSVQSFTAASAFAHDPMVQVTDAPDDAVYALFDSQDHERHWLEPLIRTGKAFACVLDHGGSPVSVCFAFENYRQVWEIGGVFTPPAHRGRGHAARVVRTALAEIATRRLVPRYQVHDDNRASVLLAESISLRRFLTITHYLYKPALQ